MNICNDWITWLISTALGLVAGALLTYITTRKLDKEKEKKQLYIICERVCFYLDIQYRELLRLSENIKERLSIIRNIDENNLTYKSDDLLTITQYFYFDDSMTINFEHATNIISTEIKNSTLTEVLHNIFLCNQNYVKTLSHLKSYHDAKKDILTAKEKDRYRYDTEMISFSKKYMPVYLHQCEYTLNETKETFDKLKSILKSTFGFEIKLSI